MAITKEIVEDKIEVVGDYKAIQIREATVLKEDGKELTRSFHRKALQCVVSSKDEDGKWTHTDTDVSKESDEVKAICAAVWTDAVKTAAKAFNEANSMG
jgi:hypothetical protein|tara:strand:- start:156 stop:452 length:297 start_codon:yes stop_codon:yes gene_type:complete